MWGLSRVFVIVILVALAENTRSSNEIIKRQTQVSTPMRLVNGTSKYEGRLEVFHNNTWGTVCDDYFTDRSASTICRILKLGTIGFPKSSAYYGAGTLPILFKLSNYDACKGTEDDIDLCRHRVWGTNNCQHREDVGIKCIPWYTRTTRLVGSKTPWEGRLEVLLGNEWRSVCSSGFGRAEAELACKSMNYSSSGASVVDSRVYTIGEFPVFVENIQCTGNEDDLIYCQFKELSSACPSIVAIECGHTPIRLVGGPSATEGRVEVQHNGQWGTVCDNGFGQEEANVVCRMLGLGQGQAQAYANSKYGRGTGSSLLDSLQCHGHEQDLSACTGARFSNYNCGQGNDAGVNCTYTPVRLVNGSSPYEGRVEVMYNGSWGTICDDSFDVNDARVICRMLGFSNRNPQYLSNARFGNGSGLILLDDLGCIGTEQDIALCKSRGWAVHNCAHSADISVVCANDWDLRLSNGNAYWDGRLEIRKNGRYGVICKHGFTKITADSVCKYLGFNSSRRIYFRTIYDEKPISTIDSSCSFNKTNGMACSVVEAPLHCSSVHDSVWIECMRTPVRLVQGSNSWEGRVEVFYDNHWGTVCRSGFDVKDASVVCNMLGYDINTPTVYSYARFGQGGGPVWVSNLNCTGFENDLSACHSDQWIPGSCSHSQDISIACSHNVARLVNGSMPFEGRLEIHHNSSWMAWYPTLSSNAALTVCRMIGYNETDILSRQYYRYTFGQSPVLLSWNIPHFCSGKEMDISGCIRNKNRHPTWSHTTSHNEQGVSCTLNARLSNGPNRMTGRLELLRNNKWGTVCDVNFSDIHATAICRMIAGSNQARYVTGKVLQAGYFGKGTGPTWKFRNGCGTNGDIPRCLLPDSHFTDCGHDNDVSIICKSNISIRLTGGSSNSEGTIEMEKNGTWGALCDNSFYQADAISTCRRLGFWVNSATLHRTSYYGGTSLPKWLLQPNCQINDFDISLCNANNPYQEYTCNTAGVQCTSTALGRNNIRLIGGKGDWVGMVEVKLNGNWGGICWTNWDNSSTDVICKMLRYRGSVYQSFPVTKGTEPLFVANLNCTGNEDDIGLCKASNDISICSHDSVSVDCSGGVEVRLVGGNTSFEGRVEIRANGTWGTLCDSSWSYYDAKVICSMLGFRDTSPTVLNNAHFGQGTGAVKYTDLGCSGWEDHIGQCITRTSGSCSHSDDAGVKCFSCVKEYNTETGTIASPNYPGNYPSNTDCVYVIKPKQNGTIYGLHFDNYNLYYYDFVEIQEASSSHHIAKYTHSVKPDSIIPGKDFFIRFKSTSSYPGFHLSWKPLTVHDAVTAGCGSTTWDISVNMTLLKYIYPDSRPDFIFMTNPNCKGVIFEDTLVFKEAYSGCGTTQQTTSAGMKYTTTIMYPEASGVSFPVIIRHFRWKMDVDCLRGKTDSGNVNFKPDEATSTTNSPYVHNPDGHISGSIQHSVNIQFYKDRGFFEELTDNPLVLHIGENVYVKVSTKVTTGKMRLHTCITSPYSGSSLEYVLIKDGCIKDSTTHILTQTNNETKFVFTAFEFPTYTSNVYVTCNATFCNTYDNSDECNQRCHNTRHVRSVQTHDTVTGRSRTFFIRKYKEIHNENGYEKKMIQSKKRHSLSDADIYGY